ncbi:MAG: hypothetical protein M3083_21600 [Actinomycetota bacterium]|nr:hypothetical protein [Actinomycetota bacterium]
MDNPIVHFEILGREGASLIAFYRDLFGWPLREVPVTGYSTYAYIPVPEEGIGGGVGKLASGDQGFVTIYVEVAARTRCSNERWKAVPRSCSRLRRYRGSVRSPASATPRATS